MEKQLFERKCFARIKNQLTQGKIQVLVGSRQVGKTSILKYLQREMRNVIYLDVDRLADLSMFETVDSFLRFIQVSRPQKNGTVFVFVDEFQQIPHVGKILKAIHDHHPDIQFIVSGSSSLNIMQHLDESLAGRKRVHSVYPLDFEEYLLFTSDPYRDYFSTTKSFDFVPEAFPHLQHHFEEFIQFGGYPAVSLLDNATDKVEELNDIVRSYIEKDIKSFFKIDNILTYNKLLKRLSLNIGNLLNMQSVAGDVGIARQALDRYLFLLANTYIIDVIAPFYQNKINELKKMSKLFFVDTGIRNFLIANVQSLSQRTDMGALVENAVYSELLKNKTLLQEIKFWRTTAKSEVDFILLQGDELIPIEVKYQNNVTSIPRTIKSFIDSYHPARAWVVTKSQSFLQLYKKCEVSFLPAFFSSKIVTSEIAEWSK